jgi:hypothetical protein
VSEPDRLWQRVIETGLIDLTEPIAVLVIAVLHFRQPGLDGVDLGPQAAARYRELLPSGSYLAISHASADGVPEHVRRAMEDVRRMYSNTSSNVIYRNRDEMRALFGDFELVEPGIDWLPSWHPEEASSNFPAITYATPNESALLAGIGRKP